MHIDYTLPGFSNGIGKLLVAHRERFEPLLSGRRVIEIGSGEGDLIPFLFDLGVNDYCAVEMDGHGLNRLCYKLIHASGQEDSNKEVDFKTKYLEAQKRAIENLVSEARKKEKRELSDGELLRKYFFKEAQYTLKEGALFELYRRTLKVNGTNREVSCFYSPDLLEFLRTQQDQSAVIMSAGVLRLAFIHPIENWFSLSRPTPEYEEYTKNICKEVYRITPAGSITVHAEQEKYVGSQFGLIEAGFERVEHLRQSGLGGAFMFRNDYLHAEILKKPKSRKK